MIGNRFGRTLGCAMVATLLFIVMAVVPVVGQNPYWRDEEMICDWSDYAIESLANFVGTYKIPPEECLPHPMEFKVMIFTGAFFCVIMFILPCALAAYTALLNYGARIRRIEPTVLVIITVISPFVQ